MRPREVGDDDESSQPAASRIRREPPCAVSRERRPRDEQDDAECPERRRMRLHFCELGEMGTSAQNSSFGYLLKSKEIRNGKGALDVAEIFSPPRVSDRARRRNLSGGWSLDIAATDPVTGKNGT